MRNFRLDDESGHQEALFSWAAYRTGLMPELQYMYHVSYKPYGKEQLRQRSRNKAAFSIAYISGAGNHRRRGG